MEFPDWQLHRGYWQEGLRENTMFAFEEAHKMGCQAIELDVQVSRDGVPHVFHDFSLKRFFHIEQKISKTSSEDLQGLNIVRLQEVLQSDQVPSNLNIEIKSLQYFPKSKAESVCRVIDQYGADKNILVSSFNPMVLHWVKRALPSLPRALILADDDFLFSWRFAWAFKLAEPNFLNCHYALVDHEKSRDRLLSFGTPIMVWTVNNYHKARFYLKRGARSIISDLPPASP